MEIICQYLIFTYSSPFFNLRGRERQTPGRTDSERERGKKKGERELVESSHVMVHAPDAHIGQG